VSGGGVSDGNATGAADGNATGAAETLGKADG
jgi:hypothetical protein